MPRVDLIVVQLLAGDPLDGLVEALRQSPGIELVAPHPVGLDEALALIASHGDVDVVLLMGPAAEIRDATERIRDRHRTIHIASIKVEPDKISLALADPNIDELSRIITSLGEAKKGWFSLARGKVLPMRPREGRAKLDPRPLSRVPAVIPQAEVEPDNLRIVSAGLDWLDKAAGMLVEIWADQRQGAPGFPSSWGGLQRWLAAIAGLIDAPAEQSERAWRAFEAALQSAEGRATPLGTLAAKLGDDALALKLLLIACASEFDLRFQRLFGTLHDDFARRTCSLGLACTIIAAAQPGVTPLRIRAELELNAALRQLGLGAALGIGSERAEEPLRTPPGLVEWLLSGDAARLAGTAGSALDADLPAAVIELIPAERLRSLRHLVRAALAAHEGQDPAAVLIGGSEPGWLAVEAAGLEFSALLAAASDQDLPDERNAAALAQLVLAANLADRRLVLDLSRNAAAGHALWRRLIPLLERCRQPPFVVAGNPAALLGEPGAARIAAVQFPPPTAEDRANAIAAALAASGEYDRQLASDLAAQLPLAPARLPQAVTLAQSEAAGQGRPLAPTRDDWMTGFRRAASATLPQLAQRIEPAVAVEPAPPGKPAASQLDRVILPETQRKQLEEIVLHVRFGRAVMAGWGFAELIDGRGVAALFAGESGTGKTTAAHAVASELSCDLFVIDLSQVVSKYIGETEKNLEAVFAEAESAGAALLFDEADALFGKRSAVSDAHDRYANIEVAYLLQRMQRFAGLAMLTSNNAANLDPAFARRLRFRVEFPRPSAGDRLAIWVQSLPPEHRAGALALNPREALKPLAAAFDVTGGTIRNMAFHAAVLASEKGVAIGMEQVFAGVRSQLVRLGKYDDLARLDAIAAKAAEAAKLQKKAA